jgi:photosystem II stability/assembly factor-like uncharacterized protein
MRKLILILTVLIAGCDGGSDGSSAAPQAADAEAPAISDLVLSPDAVMYMEGDGSLTASAALKFVDPDLDIESMQVDLCDGTHYDMPLAPMNTASGTMTEELRVPTTELGTCMVEIWLTDAAGHASNHLSTGIEVLDPTPAIANLGLSPETAMQMEGDGEIIVRSEFDYLDADLDLERVVVEISDGTSQSLPLGPVDEPSGALTVEFAVSTLAPGVMTVDIWLVDAGGHRSNRLNATIQVIENNLDWQMRVSGLPHTLNDVYWNGRQFLAVGDGGLIMRSEDGIAWSRVESGVTENLNAIIYVGVIIHNDVNSYFVVGDGGTVISSADNGEHWSPTPSQGPDEASLRVIRGYAFGSLVAAGKKEGGADTAFIMNSHDFGRTWTIEEDLPQSGRSITDMVFAIYPDSPFPQTVATTQIEIDGNGKDARVLVSSDGFPDGSDWIEVVLSTESIATYSILHDGEQFWAAGRVGRMYTSADGINWTEQQTSAGVTRFRALAWSGSSLIADGENEFYGWGPVDSTGTETSDSGKTWTTFGIAADYDTRGLTWGNGRFVSVGCEGSDEQCVGLNQGGGAIFSTR